MTEHHDLVTPTVITDFKIWMQKPLGKAVMEHDYSQGVKYLTDSLLITEVKTVPF